MSLQIFDKTLDMPEYFGLYKFTLCMGTHPLLMPLEIYLYTKIDWTKTTLRDKSVSYDFESGTLLAFEEHTIPASKRARGAVVAASQVNLQSFSALYRNGVSRVTLTSMWCSYDKYRGAVVWW